MKSTSEGCWTSRSLMLILALGKKERWKLGTSLVYFGEGYGGYWYWIIVGGNTILLQWVYEV